MIYRLTVKAAEDIERIYVDGIRLFGAEQAVRYHARIRQSFETLARHPELARERIELSTSVRIHPCGTHIIIYKIDKEGVLIVRVRHGHEDWLDS
ncbi:type II toxin-antitoxin system RelE/ParE family toxin [Jiella marina]|uniref:type II toxin-antitoxin system RelE/ParE family toxin n=1 Tax=Jiella sp. LLJ827 TaxID=2917712 RepID=UPI002100A4AD|nr:type II toxin-antitoxin system RelE/ParE family toxin [Jiella sp. LLJ827]MCQ0988960.1 type II toxin-antitoxin system RelE/ParE family toxin [Jiella sp. LLJ827]